MKTIISSAFIKTNSQSTAKSIAPPTSVTLDVDQLNTQDVQNEVRQAIEHLRQSQKKAKEINTNINNYLPIGERIQSANHNKAIQRYKKQEHYWNSFIQNSCKKVKKPPQASLLLNSEYYREREEQRQLIEAVRTDQEKYGDQLWYKQLRNYESKEEPDPYKYLSKVEKADREVFYIKQYPTVEVIRRPKSAQQAPGRQFKTNSFQVKMQERNNIVKKVISIDQPEYIEVIGQNKFKSEVQNALNLVSQHQCSVKNPSKPNRRYIKPKLAEDALPGNVEEIIAIHYDKQELNRQGRYQATKMNFRY